MHIRGQSQPDSPLLRSIPATSRKFYTLIFIIFDKVVFVYLISGKDLF
jgi:hypothetical protein